eukprot:6212943-Pleurochrysis_carterae.AAC.1
MAQSEKSATARVLVVACRWAPAATGLAPGCSAAGTSRSGSCTACPDRWACRQPRPPAHHNRRKSTRIQRWARCGGGRRYGIRTQLRSQGPQLLNRIRQICSKAPQ